MITGMVFPATHLVWDEFSFSVGDGACVEVACGQQVIAIRDSRDPCHIMCTRKNQWELFLIEIKHKVSVL
jgi:hypothetical protein